MRLHLQTMLTFTVCFLLVACGPTGVDQFHFLIRSPSIRSFEEHDRVVGMATLHRSDDGRIPILVVRGTPYERGYQQGAILREQVRDNLLTLYNNALSQFYFEEIFAEAYERLRPHIPEEYIQEMHGLAHGARLPLHVVHAIHALPSISEWGGKKEIKKVVKKMYYGDSLGTSCSNFSALPSATANGTMYTVRILDWGLHKISKLHEYPLITVTYPKEGIPSANIGWAGFLGAVSGINAEQITLGEMGYGSPPNETLDGTPMPFLLREVMTHARDLSGVRRIISGHPGTNSFGFLMTDGKTKDAELYIRDRDRFVVFRPGEPVEDRGESLPGIASIVYGGHYEDRLHHLLSTHQASITPELLQKAIIPDVAMKSNFQNVIYAPESLAFWVSYAKSKSSKAFTEEYTYVQPFTYR